LLQQLVILEWKGGHMARNSETETTTLRVTKEGKDNYDKLHLKYGGKFRRPAFLEELCKMYETAMSKKDVK